MREKGIDYAELRRLFGAWRDIGKFYYGDYYPLTPYSQADDAWIAWQFNRPESGDGMIQVFRRPKSGEDSKVLILRGLDTSATYEVTQFEGKNALSVNKFLGTKLTTTGVKLTLTKCPEVAVLIYKRISP